MRQDSDAGLFAHPWVRCISQLGKVLELAGSADPAGRHGARFALLSSHSLFSRQSALSAQALVCTSPWTALLLAITDPDIHGWALE